ncbi:hypothetical protein M3Y94_00226200 [Aphelenchoides besseyi]|nr:hypothetical protein M3Y94_00226200 [Aphelenchoides besseyi]KAI6236482.1 hypothetical protein M3Y95_00162400 [Aphelenchoides besseyi]
MFFTRLSAVLVAGGIAVCTFCCPHFTRSRKGILFVHYVFATSASSWFCETTAVGTSVTTAVLGSSVLIILMEHALTLNIKEPAIERTEELMAVFGAVISIDALAVLLHFNAFGLSRLLCISGIVVSTTVLFTNPRKSSFEMSLEQLVEIGEETFFYDLARPVNCLGRRGWFHWSITMLKLSIGMISFISTKPSVVDLFSIAQCASAWMLITSPPFIAGLIQSMKLCVRSILEIEIQQRVEEAEQQDKEEGGNRRSKEEIRATIEGEYGEDVGMATELI